MASPQQGLALDQLAAHLYGFLPGSRMAHADQSLTFGGVAAELGLSAYWRGGSKQPAIRHLLEGVLNSGTGKFSALIERIVVRGITHRQRSDTPVCREDIEQLNGLVEKLGFKIPNLRDPAFLVALPGRRTPVGTTQPRRVDPNALAGLHGRLMALQPMIPQARGLAFEDFLSDLFEAYGLAPRGGFRITGEQIDGSFQLGQEVYLLEAKWQDGLTPQRDLLAFYGKIDGKAVGAFGLFVSYCGFTAQGLEAFARGKRTNLICMNGLDLSHILSGQLALPEVIARKRRRAIETNSAFVPVRDLFSSVT